MAYRFSKYVRDGLSARILTEQTFGGDQRKFAYEWGIFKGGQLQKGLQYTQTYEQCTLPHLRPLPFGKREPCHMSLSLYGNFVDGLCEGYCHGLDTNGFWYTFGFFHKGEKTPLDAFRESAEKEVGTDGVTIYRKGEQTLVYTKDGELAFVGECDLIGLPEGYAVDFRKNNGRGSFAYFEAGDESTYLNTPVGEEHPVWAPDGTGFSTQTKVTYLRRGVQYQREEGTYQNGVLHGIGAREWETTGADTHPHYEAEGGIYYEGQLIWGYHTVWDNGAWEEIHPDYFQFVGEKPAWYIEHKLEDDEECYVGEILNGVPNGIGTYTLPERKIVGMWQDGKLHGWGAVFIKKDNKWLRQHEGIFVEGSFEQGGIEAYCKKEKINFV